MATKHKNRGIIKGAYYIFFLIIQLIAIILFFILPKESKYYDFLFSFLLFTIVINFFNIYDPLPKKRIKILWMIRLFLFGEPYKENNSLGEDSKQ